MSVLDLRCSVDGVQSGEKQETQIGERQADESGESGAGEDGMRYTRERIARLNEDVK